MGDEWIQRSNARGSKLQISQEPQILRHYIERMNMSYRALVNGCIPFESNFSPYAEYIPIHGRYLHRMCCASSIPQGITPKKTSSQSWCSTWARLDFSFWKLEFAGTPCHHLPDGFRCEDQTNKFRLHQYLM